MPEYFRVGPMQLITRPHGYRVQTGYVKENGKFVPHGGERWDDRILAIYRHGKRIVEMIRDYPNSLEGITILIEPNKTIKTTFCRDGTIIAVSERTQGRAGIPTKEFTRRWGKDGKIKSETEYISGKAVMRSIFNKKRRPSSTRPLARGKMVRELIDQEEARILLKSW